MWVVSIDIPSMHSSEFNTKIKKYILVGDFNIDLLKYDTHGGSSDFLDAMYANFLLPYISVPSRVTPHSKTLIDNIFSNMIEDSSKKTLQIQKYIIRLPKD